jgi:hypothetical protein
VPSASFLTLILINWVLAGSAGTFHTGRRY